VNTDVDGLRVIVTAGAGGIGRAIAEEFASGGAHVAVCDVDEDALDRMRSTGSAIQGRRADAGDEADVGEFVTGAVAELGGVDVLVNNAGIAGPGGRVEELDVEGWRRTLDVNITGMFLTTRLVIPHLKTQRSGSIVNISSTAGLHGFAFRAPYTASKWAVIGFTKTLAMELGEFGVRANALCPGSVDNDRMRHVVELEAAASGRTPEEIRAGFERQASLQVFMQPEDIAAMVRFVCSPAGAHISGQALAVDGHIESMRT
jgi:NAD(P)-dependent dehydrogenase (short-subunit alcohol dehydrogenase family)